MKRFTFTFFIATSIILFSCNEDEHFDAVSISDFEPKQGEVGTTVTISGKNFDTKGRNQVWFGSTTLGFSARIIHSAKTELTVEVPEDAPTDYIWVECYHPKYILKASSREVFTVLESESD